MSPIEIDGTIVKEIIECFCDLMIENKYDKIHVAVALQCILRTLAKDGIEIEFRDIESDRRMM